MYTPVCDLYSISQKNQSFVFLVTKADRCSLSSQWVHFWFINYLVFAYLYSHSYTSFLKQVGSISAFNKVPRFGRTSDITEIYVNDSIDTSTVVDYIRGTLFVAGFLIAVCLLWLVLLICCKCLGRRAGIYAGFPPKPDSMANLSENRQSRPKKATILIIVCAILITFSGITFFVRGAISLERLLWNVEDSATVSTIHLHLINISLVSFA